MNCGSSRVFDDLSPPLKRIVACLLGGLVLDKIKEDIERELSVQEKDLPGADG